MVSLPLYPLQEYLKKVEAAGLYDVRRAWERVGFSLSDFDKPDYRVNGAQYFQYWHGLVSEPSYTSNLATIAKHAAHSPLLSQTQLVICAPNLDRAFSRLSNFPPLTAPVQMRSEWQHGEFLIRPSVTEEDLLIPEPLLQFLTIFIHEIHCLCTMQETKPKRLAMPRTQTGWDIVENVVGIEVSANEEAIISYDEETAKRPFFTHNELVWEGLLSTLNNRIAENAKVQSMAMQVKIEITAALSFGLADIDTICRKLHMSRRSLQRRLGEEETSFQEIITDIRKDQSKHFLANEQLSIAEIAHKLGYSNAAAFTRAFKSWTGATPNEFRKSGSE